ncbi:MAG: LacI family transcriptional regulator [Spirochaetales bacterium]|nr:LacI family transcriptional regulator [Spirochaetales bacterium]
MKVSHQSLADALGLSQSTVSRALNGNKRISDTTRELVRKKAYEMGYFDDAVALLKEGILPSARPNIGLLLENICNPFFSTIISGVQDHCALCGYNLLIANSNMDVRVEKQNIENFKQLGVKGLILHTHKSQEYSIQEIAADIPRVFICDHKKFGIENSVGIDSTKGIFTATEYLIQLGHRQIVFIGGSERFSERIEGFQKAQKEYNIPVKENSVVYCAPTRIGGYNAVLKLMETLRDFTGIVCVNDFVAFGVLEGIKKRGFRVPDDYSVIGLDNVEVSSYYGVDLTTVNQPSYQIGKTACELVLEKIKTNDLDSIVTRILEYSLVIRKTCRGISPER